MCNEKMKKRHSQLSQILSILTVNIATKNTVLTLHWWVPLKRTGADELSVQIQFPKQIPLGFT